MPCEGACLRKASLQLGEDLGVAVSETGSTGWVFVYLNVWEGDMKYTKLIVSTICIVIFCVGRTTAETVSTATDVQPTPTPIPPTESPLPSKDTPIITAQGLRFAL